MTFSEDKKIFEKEEFAAIKMQPLLTEINSLRTELKAAQQTIKLLTKNPHVADLIKANSELIGASEKLQKRLTEAEKRIKKLEAEVESYKRYESQLNEAFNTGDGSYHP